MKIIARKDKCHGIPIALMIVVIFCLELFCASVCASDHPNPAQLLDEAERQARKAKDEDDRWALLESIAMYRAEIGQIKESKLLLKELEPHFAKSFGSGEYILLAIARQIARSGDVEAAVEAALAAGNASTTVRVVVIKNKAASGLDSSSDAERPKETQPASSWKNDEPLYAVAEELFRHDMYDAAIKIVEQTSRPDNIRRRAQVMNEFAAIAALRGRKHEANGLFDRAELLSNQLMSEGEVDGAAVELSLSIAAQRRLCGDGARADRTFQGIWGLLTTVKDRERKDQFLANLVDASAAVGNFQLAKEALAAIAEPMRKIQGSDALAKALLNHGQLEEALGLINAIHSAETRIGLLLLLAEIQAKSDPTLARKTMDVVVKSLNDSSDDYRPWFMATLASIEYTLGNRRSAIALWKQAIRLADRFTIHPDRERQNLIGYIAQLQVEVGDEKDAIAAATMLQNHDVFSDISERRAKSGKAESALKWIKRLKDPSIRAHALLGVVSGLLDVQEDKRRLDFVDLYECK
jgi:tetratricopeptide (TPR) repeat protein